MKKIISFIRDGKLEEIMGMIAIATVIIPVIINIFNRTFLSKYSLNLEATALLAYVWIGYGFFGYMYKKDAHVDMKFIVNMMGPKLRWVFDLLRDIVIFVFCAYLCYWGCKLFSVNTAKFVAGTKIPLAIGFASIAFGYFSGAVRSAWAILLRFVKLIKKEEVTE